MLISISLVKVASESEDSLSISYSISVALFILFTSEIMSLIDLTSILLVKIRYITRQISVSASRWELMDREMKVLSGKVSYYSGWIINHKRIFADVQGWFFSFDKILHRQGICDEPWYEHLFMERGYWIGRTTISLQEKEIFCGF